MKVSVTVLSVLALLVVSLGLIATAAADGETAVDSAMNIDDPSVSTLAAPEKDGELDAEDPVSDTDGLGPVDEEGTGPDKLDGVEGDYNDGIEVDPSEDFEGDDELLENDDEDIMVMDDDEERYDDDDPEFYDDNNEDVAPETDNVDEEERVAVLGNDMRAEGDAGFAAGDEGAEVSSAQRDGQYHRHHHHHEHQQPHIHLRCHPAHIALFLLVAVAIGLAGRRLRRQRRAAYQSVPQSPNGEVPVVVVMGKLKEDDDDLTHESNGFPLGRPVSSNPCTTAV